MSVGVAHQPALLLHRGIDRKHPETPQRLTVALDRLHASGLLDRCAQLCVERVATDDELLLVHTPKHLENVAAASLAVKNRPDAHELREPHGDGAIYYHESTEHSARCAVGSVLEATHAALHGQVRTAFALVRPPSHHAEADEALGFCFFNATAVAAAAALKDGVERVAVLDWDVHHGNGTQHIFDENPNVLFISIHRFGRGFFPGTGALDEVGEGRGRGKTVNVPWVQAGLGDADYGAAFELVVMPILREFAPQLLLISAGFDAAKGDVQGKMRVTPSGFAHLARMLLSLPNCASVAVFEGGYQPEVCAECVEAVIKEMLWEAKGTDGRDDSSAQPRGSKSRSVASPIATSSDFASGSCGQHTEQTLRQVISMQREFWACLRDAEHARSVDHFFGNIGSRKRRRS